MLQITAMIFHQKFSRNKELGEKLEENDFFLLMKG